LGGNGLGNSRGLKKMSKQKNSINITPDDKLLALIDKEAEKEMRTRKAQVLYIIREHFNRQEEKLEAIEISTNNVF
jgi:hypothetical protein